MIITITNQSRILPQPDENQVRGSFQFAGSSNTEFSGQTRTVRISGAFDFKGESKLEFSGNLFETRVNGSFAFSGSSNFAFAGRNVGAREIFFKGETSVVFNGRVGIPLNQPEPILNELPENAFAARYYSAKLFIDGVQIPIRSFQYSRAKGTTGARLNITLVNPSLEGISNNPTIKFQIGKRVSGNWTFYTLVDNSKIDSKSYSLSFSGDNLSFSSQSLLVDKLSTSPRRNMIAFSSSKIGVDIDELEPLYIAGGGSIQTQLRPFSILTLYSLFNLAFVEGCGFSEVMTNIPNFEVLRCDFEISQTFLSAVSGVIGVFEPIIFAVGNVLWIIDKTQAIPEDFSPRVLRPAKITGITAQTGANSQIIDGYEVQYVSNAANGLTSTRTKTEVKYYGALAVTTTETIKDWKDSDGAILKTELVSRRVEKKTDFTLSVETLEHTFDGQGKKTLTLSSRQARVPNPNAAYERILTDVAESRTEYSYGTDPRNSRRIVPREIVTYENKLVVIDSDNQYLGEDFTQDIQLADKSGNIAEGMTTAYVPVRTKVETFKTLGNGQVETTRTVLDHLRGGGAIPDDDSDTSVGDISLNAVLSRPRSLIVFRSGVNATNKKYLVVPLAIGEMPLQLGKELAARKLQRVFNQPFDAQVEVPGFDETLEIGVYFSLPARNGDLGNYLTEGFTVSGDSSGIKTQIETTQI